MKKRNFYSDPLELKTSCVRPSPVHQTDNKVNTEVVGVEF